MNNLINPIYWENLRERGRQRKTEEGKSTVTIWNKKEVEAEVIRGQGKMWKRTMWKHILLEYADVISAVEKAQSWKKSVEKNSHNSKYRVNRKEINAMQQKQTKQNTKRNRENLDNSFDVAIIPG